jgi:hypothetical protein
MIGQAIDDGTTTGRVVAAFGDSAPSFCLVPPNRSSATASADLS